MRSSVLLSLLCLLSIGNLLQITDILPSTHNFSVNATSVKDVANKTLGNLKWDCDTCATTCSYGVFNYYCADKYYCVCMNVSLCPGNMDNDCS